VVAKADYTYLGDLFFEISASISQGCFKSSYELGMKLALLNK